MTGGRQDSLEGAGPGADPDAAAGGGPRARWWAALRGDGARLHHLPWLCRLPQGMLLLLLLFLHLRYLSCHDASDAPAPLPPAVVSMTSDRKASSISILSQAAGEERMKMPRLLARKQVCGHASLGEGPIIQHSKAPEEISCWQACGVYFEVQPRHRSSAPGELYSRWSDR